MRAMLVATVILLTAGAAQIRADGAPSRPKPKAETPKEAPKEAPKEQPEEVPKDTAVRITAALEWLRDHQNFSGYWSASQFGDDSIRKDARKTYNVDFAGPGKEGGDKGWQELEIGVTSLAMLAFTGAGHDHKSGDFKETLRRAVMHLRRCQGNDGCIGSKDEDQFVYAHAAATMALAEGYGLSSDNALKTVVESGVKFLLEARNPGKAWRYGVKPGDNDTSFTGWAVLALKSAKMAGIEFDTKEAFAGAASWLDEMTVETKEGYKTGYNTPGGSQARLRSAQEYELNPTMEAINITLRLFMGDKGWDAKHKVIASQAKAVGECKPAWEANKIDFVYWWWATLAMYQLGDKHWEAWGKAMERTLMTYQRGFRAEDKAATAANLDEYGSWDAVDAWSAAGGRVYATALNALTLSVVDRAGRTYKRVQKEEK